MALDKEVEQAVEALISLGVLNVEGCKKLAGLMGALQQLGLPQMMPQKSSGGKKGRRSRVTVTKEQIAALRAEKLSNAQMAEKLGISVPTLSMRIREFGLQKRAGPSKKKVSVKKKRKKKGG